MKTTIEQKAQMMQLAIECRNVQVVRELVEYLDELKDIRLARLGFTPLMDAISYNCTDIVKYLLSVGADIHATTFKTQKNILHLAAKFNAVASISLIASSMDISSLLNQQDSREEVPLFDAIRYKSSEMLQCLLDHGASPDIPNKWGDTPLHLTARHQDLGMAKQLIGAKATVDASNKTGKTPLCLAIQHDCVEMVEWLHSQGASVQAVDVNGKTPLHVCAWFNAVQCCKFLLSLEDLDTSIVTRLDKTPLDIAKEQESHECVALLETV